MLCNFILTNVVLEVYECLKIIRIGDRITIAFFGTSFTTDEYMPSTA